MAELFSAGQRAVFQFVLEHARTLGLEVYVVGGVVRDLFLGHRPLDKDIDFLVEGNAIILAESLVRVCGGELKRFDSFFTAKIVAPRTLPAIDEIDLASARTEVYPNPGALPTVALASMHEDLKRRDFTVNAMALPLEALLESDGSVAGLRDQALDFYGGLSDLDSNLVRVLHAQSFIDDPTRIFRCARYVQRLRGSVEKGTEELIRDAIESEALEHISEQRKLNEIKKVLTEERPLAVLRQLQEWGVLEKVDALRGQSENVVARWAAFEGTRLFEHIENRFGLFTALCAAAHQIEVHEQALRGFGCSKKALTLYRNLSQFAYGQVSRLSEEEKLGDEVLVAAFLSTGREDLKRRLSDRGLAV